jgi:hypothetical protein
LREAQSRLASLDHVRIQKNGMLATSGNRLQGNAINMPRRPDSSMIAVHDREKVANVVTKSVGYELTAGMISLDGVRMR